MGVEYYIVCNECKEYIECHKCYELSILLEKITPPVGYETDPKTWNYYWVARGVWFMWKHRGHKDIEIENDCYEGWYDKEPFLKEVFPHDDDLKLREKNEYIRKDGN